MSKATGSKAGLTSLSNLLPAAAEGYVPVGPDRFFTADTLFDLIDGGAEIYRALNVRRTVHRRYTHPEANDIIADIFDMGSAADAYGAYHNDIREGQSAGIGRESEYQGGSLSLWKDCYYVSVVAIYESGLAARAVHAIGRAVAGAIPGDTPPPELTEWLPKDGLLSDQIYFFHDHQGLGRRYRLGDGNPLLLDANTEGLLARYRIVSKGGGGSHHSVLLLIRYPSIDGAKRAQRSFRSSRAPVWGEQEAIRPAEGGWISSFQADDTVAVVLDAPSRESADGLIEAVRSLAAVPNVVTDDK